MTQFLCPFVPPCEVSEGIMRASTCVSSYFACLLDWSFTFTEKSDCDKVSHVVSMISITTILVKLLQMI